MNIQELAKQAGWTQTAIDMASAEEMARLERFADLVLEEAANVCDRVNNYDNPMTAGECADAIRALKGSKE